MTILHLLSDSISRIKNAQLVRSSNVLIVSSKFINKFLKILLIEGYISNFNIYSNYFNLTNVFLKYDDLNFSPVINEIKVVSKPSKRIYYSYKDIKNNYNNLGTVVLSTSHGIVTDRDAIIMKCGGEVLCKIF